MSKFDDIEYWKTRYRALSNKVFRQRDYYASVAARLKLKLETEGAMPLSHVELNAMVAQLEKASADMDFIFQKAIQGLPPTEVLTLTTGTKEFPA